MTEIQPIEVVTVTVTHPVDLDKLKTSLTTLTEHKLVANTISIEYQHLNTKKYCSQVV